MGHQRGKQRHFGEVRYGAKTWSCDRRVIVKAEHTDQGSNPRFVVTSLTLPPQELYDELYCARGEMENRL
ncbi:MAG: transposase, partial [Blastocatellia bacterium]|nr:transposase [Blastocatellia bacterium]